MRASPSTLNPPGAYRRGRAGSLSDDPARPPAVSARWIQSTWRLPQGAWLERRSESLLAHALRHNSFVGFKNMDPSLVKLDTTYQVQLAYAEASSAIDFIVKQRGAEGLLGVLKDMLDTQEGGDD